MPVNQTDTLFLRIYEKRDDGVYYADENVFALDCRAKVHVRKAADAEWENLGLSSNPPGSEVFLPICSNEGICSYGEPRKFHSKGKYPWSFLVSPGRGRIAMVSCSDVAQKGFWELSAPPDFTYFIDLFDVATGNALASVHGTVHKT